MATAQQQTMESSGAGNKLSLGLVTVFLSFFIYSYFYQILFTALPKLTAQLNGMPLLSWGVTFPNLGLAFAMLLVGKLSDQFGRRALLLISLAVCLAGAIWCSLCNTFPMFIIARTVLSIGQGGLAPLCYALLGDMFEPVQRSRWVGLLNIPACIFALGGSYLGAFFVEKLSWRYIFWVGIPLVVICLIVALIGLPRKTQKTESRIDGRGALMAAVASSSMILAFSFAGTIYPWGSIKVIGLLAISIVFWALFLKTEAGAEEPIMDLKVLKNRTFKTIASASLLSSFGLVGLMIYYPLMIQGVQGASARDNSLIILVGMFLMSFIGVPAGFLLAHTKRYKWMFITGYGITLAVMFSLLFFTSKTPIFVGFIAITLAGLGMGAIPTLNTLVAQYAVPKRLLGVVTAAIYFCVMIGTAIAPAICGSVMAISYKNTLQKELPKEALQLANQGAVASLDDYKVLLDEKAMADLETALVRNNSNGKALAEQTVSAMRKSLESGLKAIYIIGVITMACTFLIMCTIPKISMDAPVKDEEAP
jgi:MFS family permease